MSQLKNIFKSKVPSRQEKTTKIISESFDIPDHLLDNLEGFDYMLGSYFLDAQYFDTTLFEGYSAFIKSSNDEFKNYQFLLSIKDSVSENTKNEIYNSVVREFKDLDFQNANVTYLTVYLDEQGPPPFKIEYAKHLEIRSKTIDNVQNLNKDNWIPKRIFNLSLGCPKLESFSKVNKIFPEVNTISIISQIEDLKNMLGFCLIKNLSNIKILSKKQEKSKIEIEMIINKYCGTDSAHAIDCQNELIDAGYEEAAEL